MRKRTRALVLWMGVFGVTAAAIGDEIPVRWEKKGPAADLASLADLPRALQKPVKTNEPDGLSFGKEREANEAEDAKRARPFYERAVAILKSSCDDGDSTACERLGGVYEHGLDEAPVDAAAAKAAYKKAAALLAPVCDKGGKEAGLACLSLGGLYNYGQGVEPNKDKAHALFKRACEMGLEAACHI